MSSGVEAPRLVGVAAAVGTGVVRCDAVCCDAADGVPVARRTTDRPRVRRGAIGVRVRPGHRAIGHRAVARQAVGRRRARLSALRPFAIASDAYSDCLRIIALIACSA